MARSNARLLRFGVFVTILIVCGFILSKGSTNTAYVSNKINDSLGSSNQNAANDNAAANSNLNQITGSTSNTNAIQNEVSISKPASPKSETSNKLAPNDKLKATFVSLARNSDLHSLMGSIRQVEDRFNYKFNYDWVFLNDEPFSEEFKTVTTALCSGKTKYGLIPKEHWSFPDWIDKEKAARVRETMKANKIIYGDSISYRHMCRYESGFFWRHELMMDYDWYWRVEPDIKIFCDIDYDIFKFMADNNKVYSFTISLPEYKDTIPTLWDTTLEFIKENPQYLPENNMMDFISDDGGKTYNGCHFWSNFEVASLKFWRGEAYTKYFEYLDKAGGFFYERWGDAPVHSIAAALFLPRDQVHFFDDVGYYHVPFNNCPVDKEVRLSKKCMCNPNDDFTWRGYSCVPKYYNVNNLQRPAGWENYSS